MHCFILKKRQGLCPSQLRGMNDRSFYVTACGNRAVGVIQFICKKALKKL